MKTNLMLIIAVFAILSIGCKNKGAEEISEHEMLPPDVVEMNEAQCKVAGIELGSVEMKTLGSEMQLNGIVNVAPQNLVSVSAIMGGYVKSMNLMQGKPVSKGQVLAVIENPEFIELQQNYFESKSKLEYAEVEYNRQKELYQENVSSAKTFQYAKAEYKSLQSTVAALEQKLKMIGINADKLTADKISGSMKIIAPMSGYIKSVNVNIGKYVNPTDVMFEIVNMQNPVLELTCFEKDITKLAIGQEISFILPSAPQEQMTAVISQVGKSVNDDKTVKVYAEVKGAAGKLLPGMYINATIRVLNDSVAALPNEAILSFEDKNYIFVYSEKKKEGEKTVFLYKMIEVKKGVSNAGYSAVTLPNGIDLQKNIIVVKGAYNLLSALKNGGEMAC